MNIYMDTYTCKYLRQEVMHLDIRSLFCNPEINFLAEKTIDSEMNGEYAISMVKFH